MLTPVGVSVSDYISAVKADAKPHVKLTFLGQNVELTDDDIEASGLELSNYLNGDTDLTMGKAVMSSITVPVLNTSKVDGLIWSGEFKFEVGIDISGSTKWVTIGYFTGSRPEKLQGIEVIEFTAYDRMRKFDRLADEWMESLTYPMTVNDLFHSLCNYCGVSYVSGDELPTILTRSYDSTPFRLTGMNCRDVLANIAQACGCYARIDNAGNCKMVWFEDHTDDYTLTGNDEFPPVETFDFTEAKKWADLEDFKWIDLESLTWYDLTGTLAMFAVDALRVTSTFYSTEESYPLAQNGNVYTIVDNPFLTCVSDAEKVAYIKPIYDRLVAFGGYLPIRVSCIGNALIEAGDIISVEVGNNTFEMPIFCKKMVFNGSLIDEYETTGQINRAEVSPEIYAKIAEGAKYELILEEIDLVARNKYDIQSGIEIKPEGIEIDASKHLKMKSGSDMDIESGAVLDINSGGTMNVESGGKLKVKSGADMDIESGGKMNIKSGGDINIESGGDINVQNGGNLKIVTGGTLDVDTSNFIINSVLKYMKTGQWKMHENGIQYLFARQNNGYDNVFNISNVYDYYHGGQGVYGVHLLFDNNARVYDTVDDFMGSLEIDCTDPDSEKTIEFPFWFYPNDGYVLIGSSGDFRYYGRQFLPSGEGRISYLGQSDSYFTYGYIRNIYYYSLVQQSSRDVKHDIQPMEDMGDALDRLEPVTYVYDDDPDEKKRYGLIYEDTMEVLPNICTQDESNKAINYVELIPMMLKEIQDLRARVKALEEREEH